MFTSIKAKISKSCLNLARKQTTFLWLCVNLRLMITVSGPVINLPETEIFLNSQIMLSTSQFEPRILSEDI